MSCLQRFLVAACVSYAVATDSLDALAVDDECGKSGDVCALNALQLRNSILDDVEDPHERNEEEFLNRAFKNIEEALRDDSRRGATMDKEMIEKNIREAQTNLMHVSGCPSFLPEAKSDLNDALRMMMNREDEESRRREVHNHLREARDKVKHCKRDMHREEYLLQTEATPLAQSAEAVAEASSSNITLEAANYARRSTASLTCSHWGSSSSTCSGTIYGPCPGQAGGYYTCTGDWSGSDGAMAKTSTCNGCGWRESPRYAGWAFSVLNGHCHGSFSQSQSGGHNQDTCIGRCRNSGEYSCTLSESGRASKHIACSSTCTIGSLPRN